MVRPSPEAAVPGSREGAAATGARRSACAAGARRAEAARIAALGPLQRALLALDLGERYAALADGQR